MLKQFEFEDDGDGTESEIAAIRFDDGCSANVWPDDFFRCADLVAIDSLIGLCGHRRAIRREYGERQGATTSFSLGLTWTAAKLDASQPPPSALTNRTLVTSRWPWMTAASCSLLSRFC